MIDFFMVDYMFVNEWVVKHYGFFGVYGDHFWCVVLFEVSLWVGLLGYGSILMVTSYVICIFLVLCGKWIFENLFGMLLLLFLFIVLSFEESRFMM